MKGIRLEGRKGRGVRVGGMWYCGGCDDGRNDKNEKVRTMGCEGGGGRRREGKGRIGAEFETKELFYTIGTE